MTATARGRAGFPCTYPSAFATTVARLCYGYPFLTFCKVLNTRHSFTQFQIFYVYKHALTLVNLRINFTFAFQLHSGLMPTCAARCIQSKDDVFKQNLIFAPFK